MIELHHGDCLEIMPSIPDKSIDMILCDLPYGTTACKWDTIIPFDKLWEQYERIIKPNGAIALFSSEPFGTYLRISNIKYYRYDIIWDKETGNGSVLCHKRPLKQFEKINVFYKNQPTYNPQMIERDKSKYRTPRDMSKWKDSITETMGIKRINPVNYDENKKYPTDILKYNCKEAELNSKYKIHPTQKPVSLIGNLVMTYTNEGETVLDNCMGSGTTGVACRNLNRNFIGIEKDEKYFEIAKKRINEGANNVERNTEQISLPL
jgi:DNA modification methylase